MSIYQFLPCPDLSTREETFATWLNGFSNEEIQKIIDIGEEYTKTEAGIGNRGKGNTVRHDIRKTDVAWIDHNSQTSWLYDRMAFIARNLNGQFFDFDLFGFGEHFQYTVYQTEDSHYTWHMDKGGVADGSAPRKLSLVLQLSDPSEYEGGDLEFFTQANPIVAKKEKGIVYAFPSWIVHRVTPVTKGIRRTLVIWVTGPKFK